MVEGSVAPFQLARHKSQHKTRGRAGWCLLSQHADFAYGHWTNRRKLCIPVTPVTMPPRGLSGVWVFDLSAHCDPRTDTHKIPKDAQPQRSADPYFMVSKVGRGSHVRS